MALALCALNWLVPGAGYLATGQIRRGWALFGLINLVFLLGLIFNGYIFVPSMNVASPLDNIVAVLTFIVQVCHAGGTLLVLGAEKVGGLPATLLVRPAGAPYSDLGSFHFLVAGALNYFATTRLYDLLAGEIHEEGEQKENPAPAKTSDTPPAEAAK